MKWTGSLSYTSPGWIWTSNEPGATCRCRMSAPPPPFCQHRPARNTSRCVAGCRAGRRRQWSTAGWPPIPMPTGAKSLRSGRCDGQRQSRGGCSRDDHGRPVRIWAAGHVGTGTRGGVVVRRAVSASAFGRWCRHAGRAFALANDRCLGRWHRVPRVGPHAAAARAAHAARRRGHTRVPRYRCLRWMRCSRPDWASRRRWRRCGGLSSLKPGGCNST